VPFQHLSAPLQFNAAAIPGDMLLIADGWIKASPTATMCTR
jgi:hypothetical protein